MSMEMTIFSLPVYFLSFLYAEVIVWKGLVQGDRGTEQVRLTLTRGNHEVLRSKLSFFSHKQLVHSQYIMAIKQKRDD
jgi:hypothetical protein